MANYDQLNQLLRKSIEARFKDFELELLRGKASNESIDKLQKKGQKRRRDFLTAMGTDMQKFDKAVENDNRMQEVELKAFLEEFRPKSANRRRVPPAARDIAIRSEVLAQAGHMVLPIFSSSIFTADKAAFAEIAEVGNEWTNGAINSGWVIPEDPTRIRIKHNEHGIGAVCLPHGYTPPEFAAHFTFTPATTGIYELTAVLGFHGFYVLVSDDSFWNCRWARVKLTAQMNVHQYVDTVWKNFPALLDVEKDNASEVTNFDRTFFFDDTSALRAGDPVIVTVKGVVDAFSWGGYTNAELNFEAGTANYIEPLLLSVRKV